MDEKLKKIREEAAKKYIEKKKEVIPEKKNLVKKSEYSYLKYIFHKTDDNYFINVNGNRTRIVECKIRLYDEIKSLSEFGKTFNEAYVRTIEDKYYKINENTFVMKFLDIDNYVDNIPTDKIVMKLI